jgi:hypothetical protein
LFYNKQQAWLCFYNKQQAWLCFYNKQQAWLCFITNNNSLSASGRRHASRRRVGRRQHYLAVPQRRLEHVIFPPFCPHT